MPDFVMVPVPQERVLDVYALLARPFNPSTAIPSAAPTTAPTFTPAPGRATDPALIAEAYRESPDQRKRFMEYLADRPDQWISTGELGNAIGYSGNQVAGLLGAWGRHWEHKYKAAGRWFFDNHWTGSNQEYLMPADAAQIIRDIRDGKA